MSLHTTSTQAHADESGPSACAHLRQYLHKLGPCPDVAVTRLLHRPFRFFKIMSGGYNSKQTLSGPARARSRMARHRILSIPAVTTFALLLAALGPQSATAVDIPLAQMTPGMSSYVYMYACMYVCMNICK